MPPHDKDTTGSDPSPDDSIFTLNFQAKSYVEWAPGGVPVLYIEDFYRDPDAVRRFALSCDYSVAKAFYPGRHAMLSEQNAPGIAKVIEYIRQLTIVATGKQIPRGSIETDFSLLTTRPQDLSRLQGNPHVDETPLLALVYLNQSDLGGTKFYHCKQLDTAVLKSPQDREKFHKLLKNESFGGSGYICDEDDYWQPIYEIDGRYNRLVCYPGNVFHSIMVKKIPDPEKLAMQRLTQRIIFNKIEM